MKITRFPMLMFFVIVAPVMAAELYKWMDEEGVINYADKKPAGNYQADVVITHAPPEPPSESVSSLSRLEEKSKNTPSTDEQAESKQPEIRQVISRHVKDCGRARQELATLNQGRVFRWSENGERYFLNDKTVEAEINRLSKFVEADCGGSAEELQQQKLEAERFKTQQTIEDECVLARHRLTMLDKPDSRTLPSEVAGAKLDVEHNCKEATGDKTIILRRSLVIIQP